MRRLVLFVLIVFLSLPLVSVAQSQDKVTGAMVVTTTETIVKQPVVVPQEKPAPINSKPKFTMMGQVGFFVPCAVGFDIHFLAGWTFKDRVFVGAGVGLDMDFLSYYCVSAPLYANGRIYFTKNTKVRPFFDLSVGGTIPWGVYLNTSIGAEMSISKKLSIYAKAGYEAMHSRYEYLTGYYDSYGRYCYENDICTGMLHNFGFKIGLKF